jgi:hypothetical protein
LCEGLCSVCVKVYAVFVWMSMQCLCRGLCSVCVEVYLVFL